MMNITRRTAVNAAAALGAGALTGGSAYARLQQPTAAAALGGRVVVVGGGMAGTTAAKFLRLWSGRALQVTLVDPTAAGYTSNIMSNAVLTGQRSLASLRYSHATLATRYGVRVVAASATRIDPAARTVRLSTGSTLAYDRLVLAPGIVFDALPGLTVADYATRFPHAWQAGPQTTLLRRQLVAMAPRDRFVMTIPAAPYRCPPGPYERACLVADWLAKNRPGATVTVLDANPQIMAEPIAFGEAFGRIHRNITYVPNAVIDHVDTAARTVATSAGTYPFDVLNPIPPHRAGPIAARTGLVNVSDRWVGVDVLSYESTAARRIHVLGDAIGTTMPKSGHMGNAQAKVAADAVIRALSGSGPDPAPATSSACYSPITMSSASWLTGVFQYDPPTKTMKAVSIAEAPDISADNYRSMSRWFSGLMADTFA